MKSGKAESKPRPGSKAALLYVFSQMRQGKEGKKIWEAVKELREGSIGEEISA